MAEKFWRIEKNDKKGKTFLIFGSALDMFSPPSVEDIYKAAMESGLDEFSLVSRSKIDAYIKRNLLSGIEPPPLQIELDSGFDARITTNSDKTEAFLYIRKSTDSENPVDKNIITQILQRSGLKNLDVEDTKKKISEFLTSSNRELNLSIAKGIQPKRGSDKLLVAHFEQVEEHHVTRLADRLKRTDLQTKDVENATTDKEFPLSEAKTLTVVEKDDILYTIEGADRGEDGEDVFGKPIQGLPGNDPFLLDLRNIVQTHSQLKAGITGLLLIAETDRGVKLRIVPYKDASVRAVISRDKMEASLIMQAGLGAGERLSDVAVKTALNSVDLLEAISDEDIASIIEQARKTTDEFEYLFLKGEAPVPPESYQLNWNIEFPEGQNTVSVKENELILTAEFTLDGVDGKDVFGDKIPAKDGNIVKLPESDESVKIVNEEKKVKFYAESSGELLFLNNRLTVSYLKTIKKDIDEHVGDVIFPGKLIITGDIADNIKVKSRDNLTITGNANKSLLYSEASLELNGGIKGAGRGTVWAKDTVNLQYAENSRIFSGKDINIHKYCFKCIIKTNGKISMKDRGAVLLGGSISAAQGIDVIDLGSKKTIRTIVSFGQDYLIKDEIEVREKEMLKNTIELSNIENALKLSSSSANIEELRQKKVKLIKRNNALNVRIFNLKENFEFHIPSKVIVRGTVYPGVTLETHDRYFEVMEKKEKVVFDFDQKSGQIFCEDLKE